MRAIVTSIGERTTELCVWSLKRNGFDVQLIQDGGSTLWQKLRWIYQNTDEDFLRVDADTVPNRKLTPDTIFDYCDAVDQHGWWYQFLTFDWFKQDVTHGAMQFITREALPALRANVNDARHLERPESYMFRLAEFHNPRRCLTVNEIAGIHGYNQSNVERVKAVKAERDQLANYDFDLAERLSQL